MSCVALIGRMLSSTRRHYENRVEYNADIRRDGQPAVAQGGLEVVGEHSRKSPNYHLRVRFVGIALSALFLVRQKRDDSERKLGLIHFSPVGRGA